MHIPLGFRRLDDFIMLGITIFKKASRTGVLFILFLLNIARRPLRLRPLGLLTLRLSWVAYMNVHYCAWRDEIVMRGWN